MSRAHINSRIQISNIIESVDDSNILLDKCNSIDFISTRGQYAITDPNNPIYPSRNGTNKISPAGVQIAPCPTGNSYIFTYASKNFLANANFNTTIDASTYTWDRDYNGSTWFSAWSGGYNTGVYAPTVGYHAHVNSNSGINGTPCLEQMDYNTRFTYGPRTIRYIRDWLNGSSVNGNSNWVEIKAIDSYGNNWASGKTVTANFTSLGDPLSAVVDNGTASNVWTSQVGPNYVQIDLGAARTDIQSVNVYHWFSDGRTYHGTKTEVSYDGNTWYTIYDSTVSGEYAETSSGHIISNYCNTLNLTHRWLGACQYVSFQNLGVTYGDYISVSMYMKVDNINKYAQIGIYHYNPTSATWQFSNMGTVDKYVTAANRWERIYQVFQVPNNTLIDLTKAPALYIYGCYGSKGNLLVDNISMCKVPNAYISPDYYDQSIYPTEMTVDGGLAYNLLCTPKVIFCRFKMLDADITRDRTFISLYNLGSNYMTVYTSKDTGNIKLDLYDGANHFYSEIPSSSVNVLDNNWHTIGVILNTAYVPTSISDARTGYVCNLVVDGIYSSQSVDVSTLNPSANIINLPSTFCLGFDKLGNPANIAMSDIRCDTTEYIKEDIFGWTIYNKPFHDPYEYNSYVY